MPTEPHTFDSCGDLLLVLSKPSDPADTPKNTGNHEDIKDALIRNRSREQDATSNRDGGDGVPTHTYSEYSSSPEDDSGDTIKIPMLVSFRHMMLASPVFRAMLDGNFKEGRDLTSNGKVQVPLPDDDPAALAIILNIVHGHNRRVPRRVSLELLTNITILVDKYQMVEAVEFFAETWMEGLKKVIPTNYGSRTDVHRWISIAWVFNCQGNFKSMTQITTRYTGARLVDEVDGRLPIPAIILGMPVSQVS